MILLWVVIGLLIASFGFIVFIGAPYVPTHKRNVERLFRAYTFSNNDFLIDLGSGDGRILAAAAQRGIAAQGYELNPFLVFISRLRLKKYRGLANVTMRDFWTTKLPEQTSVVFVFLASPFMMRLDRKLQHEAGRLKKPIVLISYGVQIPGKSPIASTDGLVMYRYEP